MAPWKIPWTEEPGGLQSMGSQRLGHDWAHGHTSIASHGLNMAQVREFMCKWLFAFVLIKIRVTNLVMSFTIHKTLTCTVVSSDPPKPPQNLGVVSPSFYRWEKWDLQGKGMKTPTRAYSTQSSTLFLLYVFYFVFFVLQHYNRELKKNSFKKLLVKHKALYIHKSFFSYDNTAYGQGYCWSIWSLSSRSWTVYTVNNPPNWYIVQGTGEGSNRCEFAKSGGLVPVLPLLALPQ